MFYLNISDYVYLKTKQQIGLNHLLETIIPVFLKHEKISSLIQELRELRLFNEEINIGTELPTLTTYSCDPIIPIIDFNKLDKSITFIKDGMYIRIYYLTGHVIFKYNGEMLSYQKVKFKKVKDIMFFVYRKFEKYCIAPPYKQEDPCEPFVKKELVLSEHSPMVENTIVNNIKTITKLVPEKIIPESELPDIQFDLKINPLNNADTLKMFQEEIST